jgi:hypothetical protein
MERHFVGMLFLPPKVQQATSCVRATCNRRTRNADIGASFEVEPKPLWLIEYLQLNRLWRAYGQHADPFKT